MNDQPIIEAEKLCLTLGGAVILRGLSLTVRAGDYVSIIGPNGAGKSTFVKCLAGIHRQWQGRLDIEGRSLHDYSRRELARAISYVPQADGRQLPFTVHEFIMMGRYPHLSAFSSCSAEDEAVVERMLELTGMGCFRHRMMDTLSGGERQNVHIAAALAQGARVLVLDEPVTFLDYRHQVAIMRTLKTVNRESGITVVAVSHDLNHAVEWSDRILAIRDGREVFYGTPREILDNRTLQAIYDIPFKFIADPEAPLPVITPVSEA
ncbi:MAG: ABC transporter ATP-binding protein [Candidatus Pacebacteria bacterium]|nr:ABC transporter ATP-binding protein [Candidatus Paceibacterota bacterium]